MVDVPTLVTEPEVGFELTVVDLDPLRAAICAVGEFDGAARDTLAAVLQQQERDHRRIVRLDLSEVSLLDRSCLDVLVEAHHRYLELHGLLVLTGVDEAVARTLRISGLADTLFVIAAGQDPFGSVPMARMTRRHRAAKEPADATSFNALMAIADELELLVPYAPQIRSAPPTAADDLLPIRPVLRKAVS